MEKTPEFNILDVFEPVLMSNHRIIDIMGGRGRGGSFLAAQMAVMRLIHPAYFRGFILRQIYGDVRDSSWRDIIDQIDSYIDGGSLNEKDFIIRDSDMRITYIPTGNTIVAKGVYKTGQRTAKLKSLAGGTHVFIEEADEMNEADFDQLNDSLRTVKSHTIQVMRVFNPPSKNHWIWRDYDIRDSNIEGYMTATCNNADILSIHTTYLSNIKNINKKTVEMWESYKNKNPEHYYTVIRGLISEGKKGRVYKKWKDCTVQDFDSIDAPLIYALDFGVNDPTALVAIKIRDNAMYVKELIYESNLTPVQLAQRMYDLGLTANDYVIADSAGKPQIIQLNSGTPLKDGTAYFNIIPAWKPAGSIDSGISLVSGYDVYVCSGSDNIWQEYNEYKYRIDADNKLSSTPIDAYNHALDAIRYAALAKSINMF